MSILELLSNIHSSRFAFTFVGHFWFLSSSLFLIYSKHSWSGKLFGGSAEFKLLVQARCLGSLKSDGQKMILLSFSIDHKGTLDSMPLLCRLPLQVNTGRRVLPLAACGPVQHYVEITVAAVYFYSCGFWSTDYLCFLVNLCTSDKVLCFISIIANIIQTDFEDCIKL